MCAIAGHVQLDGPADTRLVAAMTAAQAHRGPDDSGLIDCGAAALGHRRLSIIDLAGGHQPMSNEDGSIWIVFNGEIYNHLEIRRDLESRGHVFRTRSDTEAIVHAYEEDGPRCVDRLRGMFAFAIWDGRQRRLLLARDRLGIKPLYYSLDRRRLTFASDLRALLLDPTVDRSIDEGALSCYLALRYVPSPATLLRGVRKLPPATVLVWESGAVKQERYWDLARVPLDDSAPSLADATLRFREAVDESVELRLMSEVPIGSFLSGGLDSTTVTAAMLQRHRGDRLKTFAVGYDDAKDDSELAWAAHAAHHLGTEHHELHLGAAEAAAAIPRVIDDLDEPVADPACVPLWFLARRAREQVTVVLSGEGGDELLAGYAAYRTMTRMEDLRSGGLHRAGALAGRLAWSPRLRRAARLLQLPLEDRYRGVSRAFDDPDRRRLRDDDTDEAAIAASLAPMWAATRGMTPLRRMIYLDTNVWLPDDLLIKADKMTMAAAIELRVPLLDHRLVEHAWSLPDQFKVWRNDGKRLLRLAARGRIPSAIIDRPKRGFATPIADWLRRPLSSLTRDVLLDRATLGRWHFALPVVESLLAEHQQGRDRSPELWSLLVLELWHSRVRAVAPLAGTPRIQGIER